MIGGSAGSLTPLQTIVGSLPADFPAAVLIVMHLARDVPSVLDQILNRAGVLPCSFAQDQQEIRAGRVYIAPPNRHLVLDDGRTRVVYGPRQNLCRPAIDFLFRAAATAYGSGVTGVILSGMLDDGVLGLMAIKRHEGTALVQEPDDAAFPDMPRNALRHVEVDGVVPASEMGEVLVKLTSEREPTLAKTSSERVVTNAYAEAESWSEGMEAAADVLEADGDTFVLSCPECGGPLSEVPMENGVGFRCVVGHGYSLETLRTLQVEYVERALWTALRTLRESVALRRRMIHRLELHGWDGARKAELEMEIDEAEQGAGVIRQLLDGRLQKLGEIGEAQAAGTATAAGEVKAAEEATAADTEGKARA